MSAHSFITRVTDVGFALGSVGALRERERWSRDELLAYQRRATGEMVAYATRHSSFYRERYGGVLQPHEVELSALPVMSRADLLHRFDDAVTEPRLKLERVERYLAELSDGRHPGEALYLGEYRVMTSGGSSGKRGVFVYDRVGWRKIIAGTLRWTEMMNLRPRLPKRRRLAAIGAPDGKHMTHRIATTLNMGLYDSLRLSATDSIDHLRSELQRHRPVYINAYPSVMAMLAEEQLAGRLSLRLEGLCTSSELRTPEMTTKLREAFSIEPFNCLGLTETGITAVDCHAHDGLHVFEDLCVFEVVDEANRPVPNGTPGARVLVTNLINRALPIIRYEVTDLVTVDDRPCACGRPFARIMSLEGRSDDVLLLPGRAGHDVSVHPIHLRTELSKQPMVTEYQIVQEGRRVSALVCLRHGAQSDTEVHRLQAALSARLDELGVAADVSVTAVQQLVREGGAGKLKLVRRV